MHTTDGFSTRKQVIRTVIVGVTAMSVSTGRLLLAKKATLGMTLSLRACRIAGNTLGCASASDRFFPGLASRRLSRERRRCDTSRRRLGHSELPARRRSGACTSCKRSCRLSRSHCCKRTALVRHRRVSSGSRNRVPTLGRAGMQHPAQRALLTRAGPLGRQRLTRKRHLSIAGLSTGRPTPASTFSTVTYCLAAVKTRRSSSKVTAGIPLKMKGAAAQFSNSASLTGSCWLKLPCARGCSKAWISAPGTALR